MLQNKEDHDTTLTQININNKGDGIMLIEKDNIYAQTGLTKQDLLNLLAEAGLRLSDAYALTEREKYHETASRLLDAWNFLLADYLSDARDDGIEVLKNRRGD